MYNVKKLLANPHYLNNFEKTPLHISVRLGDVELTKLLIEKGGDVNAIDSFENTPLSIACIDMPNEIIVKLLLHHGARVNFERKLHINLFLDCILSCNSKEQLEIISTLIEQGVDINVRDTITNRNCMHYVAITGNMSLAKLLLTNGAVLDSIDNFKFTPLTVASRHGHNQMIELFIYHLK